MLVVVEEGVIGFDVVDDVDVVSVGEVVVVGCPGVTVVVGAAGFVPKDGVAEQVLTCRPAVRDARPS